MYIRLALAGLMLWQPACVTAEDVPEPCQAIGEVPAESLKVWLDAGCFEGWEAEYVITVIASISR